MLNARRQKSARAERAGGADGEAGRNPVSDEAGNPRQDTESTGSALLEAVLTRVNLQRAWKRVKANRGSAGVDGLDIEQTARHLVTAWPTIRDQLRQGRYRPCPVRRVTIPKPDGGERELGIPTVTDRLIQQALLQVLQPILDPTFSAHSYGFRPGRRAHDAILAAQGYIQTGRKIVVDVDLEKFFDRVNHDILMDRLKKRLDDPGMSASPHPPVSRSGDDGRRDRIPTDRRHAARRSTDATDTKGNFIFERTVALDRRQLMLDLRRKR